MANWTGEGGRGLAKAGLAISGPWGDETGRGWRRWNLEVGGVVEALVWDGLITQAVDVQQHYERWHWRKA